MAPRRRRAGQIAKRWDPYHNSTVRHKSLKRRRATAVVAISDSAYESAKQEFPQHFRDDIVIEDNTIKDMILDETTIAEIELELQQNTPRKKKTTFRDLPSEILVEIARYASAPAYRWAPDTVKRRGYDIDISFSRINHKCRQAFFEYMSKNVGFVWLRFYRKPQDRYDNVGLRDRLSRVFDCPNTQKLFAGILSSESAIRMSTLRIDAEQYRGCGGYSISDVVFPVDERNMLWLCELLREHTVVHPRTHLNMEVEGVGKNSVSLMFKAVFCLCSVLRGVTSAGMWWKGRLWRQTQEVLNEPIRDLTRPVLESSESAVLVIRRKLQMLPKQGRDNRVNLDSVHLMSMITTNYFLNRRIQMALPVQHADMLLLEHFQRDFSNYLFSMPNTVAARRNFLLRDEGQCGFEFLKSCLCRSWNIAKRAVSSVIGATSDLAYWSDVLRLMMSHAAVNLALARCGLSGGDDLTYMKLLPRYERTRRPRLFEYEDEHISCHHIRSWSKYYLRIAKDVLVIIDGLHGMLRGRVLFGNAERYMQFLFWRGYCRIFVDEIHEAFEIEVDLRDPAQHMICWKDLW